MNFGDLRSALHDPTIEELPVGWTENERCKQYVADMMRERILEGRDLPRGWHKSKTVSLAVMDAAGEIVILRDDDGAVVMTDSMSILRKIEQKDLLDLEKRAFIAMYARQMAECSIEEVQAMTNLRAHLNRGVTAELPYPYIFYPLARAINSANDGHLIASLSHFDAALRRSDIKCGLAVFALTNLGSIWLDSTLEGAKSFTQALEFLLDREIVVHTFGSRDWSRFECLVH